MIKIYGLCIAYTNGKQLLKRLELFGITKAEVEEVMEKYQKRQKLEDKIATIRLERGTKGANMFRKFKVFIDGEYVGKIK